MDQIILEDADLEQYDDDEVPAFIEDVLGYRMTDISYMISHHTPKQHKFIYNGEEQSLSKID